MKCKQHILVIRFSALGDVAMAVPVVYALAQQYPDVRITVLSRPFARPLFDEYRGVKGLNALYRRLTAKQFTHVADLHAVLRSEYLRMRFNLGRFKVQHIDKHRRMRRQLVATNKVRRQLPTSFENYVDVFARLGFPISHIDFRSIFPPEGGNLGLLPKAIGPKRSWEHWIGIAPFAAHKGKIYPKELMETVIQLLCKKYPRCRLFLFGRGKDEDETFPQWEQQIPQCTNVGKHMESMHQELILMSHLDAMLSMDSANIHLASLCGVTVVSVWGATHPSAGFLPWNTTRADIIELTDLPCRPCSVYGSKACKLKDLRCMTQITPDIVADRIVEKLVGKRS